MSIFKLSLAGTASFGTGRIDGHDRTSPLNYLLYANKGTRLTDEATLRELGRLNDHQLRDIGVFRKPKRIQWRNIGRGMAAVPAFQFDYFEFEAGSDPSI